VLYPDEIKFENVANASGFPWECLNDSKNYFLYWQSPQTKKIEPFNLPDQQYYDPRVFAERVLGLPCHRKIFRRRDDLMKKLRPIFAAVIGVGLWILIMTTTGKSVEPAMMLPLLFSIGGQYA
jgi:hypothetical protein